MNMTTKDLYEEHATKIKNFGDNSKTNTPQLHKVKGTPNVTIGNAITPFKTSRVIKRFSLFST